MKSRATSPRHGTKKIVPDRRDLTVIVKARRRAAMAISMARALVAMAKVHHPVAKATSRDLVPVTVVRVVKVIVPTARLRNVPMVHRRVVMAKVVVVRRLVLVVVPAMARRAKAISSG